MDDFAQVPTGVNPSIPSVARMYDYYLGGTDNFPADREAAEKMIAIGRQMGNDAREVARENRGFLGRAVRHLAESGVRQFIDIGAGLPTQENVHQVVRRYSPDARVVYVDNDPTVLVHARALLGDDPGTIVLSGDLRSPRAIFDDQALRAHIDFDQPFAVLLVAVLHFVPEDEVAAQIVTRIRERLTPGSHLVLSHIYQGDGDQAAVSAGQRVYSTATSGGISGRDLPQITSYFAGLEILDPGIVPVQAWRPEGPKDVPADLTRPGILGAVARMG
ncbi:SAM-dependent methyltransferase [Microtetraspora malaysiensis]|uniref:SAM-dependent methyltransferase n=1 Tax=Microtetraspora malaysiensis TaxID=161358 RepID=UPI000A07AFC4|nr:SAM-dependent methyltransferase [Microtetraspora malaysiensis]